MRVLAVDDDETTRELVSAYLTQEGYEVVQAADSASAISAFDRGEVELVVLDLRLLDGDGLGVVRRIRAESEIPIIILSAKDQDVDRIVGLELGADDYLTKPFNPRELLARIKAVSRRTGGGGERAGGSDEIRATVRFADWELDLTQQRLRADDGRDVELTKAEFGLLTAFVKRPQRVLSRDQLLELTRIDGAEVFDRSIDVLILRLRRKIEINSREPRLIRTERGAGYYFDAKVRAG